MSVDFYLYVSQTNKSDLSRGTSVKFKIIIYSLSELI